MARSKKSSTPIKGWVRNHNKTIDICTARRGDQDKMLRIELQLRVSPEHAALRQYKGEEK